MSDRARRVRRGYPIHAYIGANGGGKSLAAVFDSLPDLAAGRHVVSTVRILDPATGEPHPLWVPLDSYRQILDAEKCRMLLDEVTGVASSRESLGMPPAIANMLVQLRRRDVSLAWTAPAWSRSDRIIRECTQAVTVCSGFLGETIRSDDGERLWKAKRLFVWRTYDATTFDEWSAHRRETLRPQARQFFWRPGSEAEASYDTFDAVLSLGEVTESGQCLDCGGHRRRPACVCPKPARPVVVVPETDETPSVAVELPTPRHAAGA